MDTKKLLNQINKYLKGDKTFGELFLENYEGFNLYFRITYNKRNKCYRLYWFDLNLMESYDINKYVSFEYLADPIIEHIKQIYSNIEIENKEYYTRKDAKNKVHLFLNVKTKNQDNIDLHFDKYIPIEIKEISNIISIILNNTPRKLQEFLYQLHAKLNGEETKFNYRTRIKFDLYKDDINTLFDERTIEKGKMYYDENKILFLEKIDRRYFSVVAGNQNVYLNIIDYNEEEQELGVHCSCPCDYYCKHLYATMISIKNKKYRKFFKVRHKEENENALVKFMTYDFIMCIGTIDKNLLLVNNNGGLDIVPILNEQGNLQWEIIEDNENHDLENKLQEILN